MILDKNSNNSHRDLPKVSVIIPTYNDWERLEYCLNSLIQQSYPKDHFEIVVVNNNPRDKVPDNFHIPDNCKIIEESKPGSYAARNKALTVANGEILAFTDADCQPDPQWLKVAVNFFINYPEYDRIGGKISLYPKGNKPNLAESYDMEFELRQDKVVASTQAAMTANMITKRKVFESVGHFNDKLLSLGDYEWGKRAEAYGYKIEYLDNCIVKHPARDSFKELTKKTKRMAGGHYHLANNKKEKLKLIIRNLLPPARAVIHYNVSLKSAIIIYYLKTIMAIELINIALGKKASRE